MTTSNLLKQRNLSSSEFQQAKKLKGFDKSNYKYNRSSKLYEKINLLKANKDMNTESNSTQKEETAKKVPATSKKAPAKAKAKNEPTKEEKQKAKADAKAKVEKAKADAKAKKLVEKEAKAKAKAKAKADAIKNKKPGVIASIYEFLGKRPQSTEKLAERLLERFPDKTMKSLTGTINCQIGSEGSRAKYPALKGYKVEQTVKGTGKDKIKSYTGSKIS